MRLSETVLPILPHAVARPTYDRRSVAAGIVHLGIGNFHRAHQAAYTDDLLAREPRWGIVGASLKSPGTRDALAPQDWLYTLAVCSDQGEKLRVIGSIARVLVAPEDPGSLLAQMQDPGVRIVSLSVTEKGYCHDPASGTLNEAHPDIRHDLANPGSPRSAPGFIVEALRRRRQAGVAPFTLLSCDNLPANGQLTKRIIARLAALRDPDVGAFVAGEVACPGTMVDRIVPSTSDDFRDGVAAALGVRDAWPIATEPFSQWAIEDRFPSGRPAWETVGAEIVRDIEPYETMKLRLLNGPHSVMAYLGYLAGYETIAQTIADPAFAQFAAGLMDEEVTPTLTLPPEMDLAAYKRALFGRFRNSALRHRTWQIAMDGSQKLPQRLLATIRERLGTSAGFPRLALGIAGWMRYVTGIDERRRAIDVSDPMAARLRRLADGAGPVPERLAHALLSVREIFGTDLPRHPRFLEAVIHALGRLYAGGARQAVVEIEYQNHAG